MKTAIHSCAIILNLVCLPLVASLTGCVADGADAGASTDDTSDEQGAVSEAPGPRHYMPVMGAAPVQASDAEPTEVGAGPKGFGISYHGGPLMTSTTKIYPIYYGTWHSGEKKILTDFIDHLGSSAWYKINTTYTNAQGAAVKASLSRGASLDVGYPKGREFNDDTVGEVVHDVLTKKKLPTDSNGIYVVFTSPDVRDPKVGGTYCGWHTYEGVNNKTVKFAFVPNTGNLQGCGGDASTSANGNPGIDAAVSVLAHEVAETVTDPMINAWYRLENGVESENGDLCAWQFGKTYTTKNGAEANVKLGQRDFLIQMNWVNKRGAGCRLSP